MIIPQSYKERHRVGITQRTTDTLKYVRKHSYTPEEQKHARLYAVHGMTKSGQEIPAEVNVTSFVIDNEIFYTGVISELSRHSGVNRSRANSVSSGSDASETSVKQRVSLIVCAHTACCKPVRLFLKFTLSSFILNFSQRKSLPSVRQ